MSERKQSLDDSRIVSRKPSSIGTPGVPVGVEGYEYDGTVIRNGQDETALTQLSAPRDFRVISQEVRIGPDGVQTVELQVEFKIDERATDYDIRIERA